MTHNRLYFLFILCALLCANSCKSSNNAVVEESAPEPELPAIGFFADQFRADTTTVRNGDTFAGLMSRLGMSSADAYQLTQMAGSVIDLRKIRYGNKLIAYYQDPVTIPVSPEPVDKAPTHKRRGKKAEIITPEPAIVQPDTSITEPILRYVVYEQSKIRSTVFQCSDSLAIWNYDKPVEKQRCYSDVTINSSLWNDMVAAGTSPSLIMNLADIFQWSINFFTLQQGDRFRTIFTQSVCEGEIISIDSVHFCIFNPSSGREVAALRYNTGTNSNTYWDKGGESLKRMFLKAPLKYNRISSRFTYSRRHPVTGKVRPHTAVDYAAPTGTPVYAIGDGTVTLCGWDGSGGGNRIKIKHMRGFESCYMHLSKFAKGIRSGSRVSQGQLIGYVGSTGRSTGPHLDFRIWEKGKPIDPLKLNSPASEPLSKEHLAAFNALYDQFLAEINSHSSSATQIDSTANPAITPSI